MCHTCRVDALSKQKKCSLTQIFTILFSNSEGNNFKSPYLNLSGGKKSVALMLLFSVHLTHGQTNIHIHNYVQLTFSEPAIRCFNLFMKEAHSSRQVMYADRYADRVQWCSYCFTKAL